MPVILGTCQSEFRVAAAQPVAKLRSAGAARDGCRHASGIQGPESDRAQKNPAPEGRLKIARRFSAGKSGTDARVPEGRLKFSRTRCTKYACRLMPRIPGRNPSRLR